MNPTPSKPPLVLITHTLPTDWIASLEGHLRTIQRGMFSRLT